MSSIELLNPIENGANLSYFCKYNGKKAFVKFYDKINDSIVYKTLKGLDSKFQSLLKPKYYSLNYRDPNIDRLYIQREVESYDLWRKEGIIVPKILEFDENHIVLDLIDGESVGDRIKREFDKDCLEKVIETFDKTRFLAKKFGNLRYIHSDPHLDNFMVDSKERIIPIDSALKLNNNYSDKELDLMINSFFAYSLLDKLENYSENQIKSVFDDYKLILTKKDKKFISKNVNSTNHFITYMKIREELAHRLNRRKKLNVSEFNSYEKGKKLLDLIL